MDRMSKARMPPTDAPMATAMVESLGGGTGQRKAEKMRDSNNKLHQVVAYFFNEKVYSEKFV